MANPPGHGIIKNNRVYVTPYAFLYILLENQIQYEFGTAVL